ncbi:hypothetical protein [Bacillus solimangrovi]|uniref:Uncharacterized protein n=1 Tax=Bacillus solimangrovi TaxID=1305675 RepID=A0A1E5LI95_9BACI|nr:hypothetical protein [Bacillus solimangrovi]OEH93800.1 hypothetical protein BFG57_11500 [Bacillus solimangrovi]
MSIQTIPMLNMKSGTLCKILNPKKKDVGEVVLFLRRNQYGHYLFKKSIDDKRHIICYSDVDFQIIPTEQELRDLIDLSLDLGSSSLFDQYTEQLRYGQYN